MWSTPSKSPSHRYIMTFNYLNNKNVLVTGAGGFIGSHLTEALLKYAAKVRAFVRYNSRNDWGFLEDLPKEAKLGIDVISADLRDFNAVKKATKNIDIVFHLGALIGIPYSLAFPNDAVETNVFGTLNILNATLQNKVSKVIHTSTSEVYGTAQYSPIDEKHPLDPQSPYAASKIAADKLAESFYRSYGLPVSILRPFNTFGPRQSLRAVIPTIICQLIKDNRVTVGNLKPTRDFTFVSDTVSGFLSIAEKVGIDGETFNLGTGEEISINDLIEKISSLIDVKPIIEIQPQRIRGNKSEVMRLISDNSKARKKLEWSPLHSLDDGLLLTINWLKEKQNYGKPEIYNV